MGTYHLVADGRNNLYLLNDVEIDGRRLKDADGENARRAVEPMLWPYGRNDDVTTV